MNEKDADAPVGTPYAPGDDIPWASAEEAEAAGHVARLIQRTMSRPGLPQFHVTMSAEIGDLIDALAQAQGKIKAPPRNREVRVTMKSGGSYTFKYATLDAIIEAVRKPFSEHGLWFVQTLGADESGKYRLITTLAHGTGEWIRSETPLLVQEAGPQAFGSALTYMRRYALCAMLGIAADEDDDATPPSGRRDDAPPPAVRAAAKRGAAVAPKAIPVEPRAEGDGPDWPAWRKRFEKGIDYAPDSAWLERFLDLNAVPRSNFAQAQPEVNETLDKIIDARRGMLAQAPDGITV